MSISAETLLKYRKYGDVFVETGTYLGQTTELAVNLGFKQVHTIEVSEMLWNMTKQKLQTLGAHCWLGDSALCLPSILEKINEPAVFWLDGHYSQGITGKGIKDVPLFEELQYIKSHPIKNHTILIDDVRLFGNEDDGVDWKKNSIKDVENLLFEINPLYKITREDGAFPNDILVAYVE